MTNYFPPVAFSFELRIVGATGPADAGFAEVSGLDTERESVALREGGENRFAHRLPRRVKHSNLVLKRGLMLAGSALFDWCKSTLEGELARPIETRSLTVSLLDQSQAPLIIWAIDGAWPVNWALAAFDASKSEVAVETIELAYQSLSRKVERSMPSSGLFAPGAG